jgi:hypothetical protein
MSPAQQRKDRAGKFSYSRSNSEQYNDSAAAGVSSTMELNMKILSPVTYVILSVFLLVFLTSCDKSDSVTDPDIITIADLMPRDNEISGWARIGGMDGQWKATNATELMDQINGGFELYTNNGFVEATMQSFSGTVNTQSGIVIEIQIYDQGNADNAVLVFDDPNNVFANAFKPMNPPSEKAETRKDLFSWTMKFSKSRYYVLISILTAEEKGQDVLEIFANNLAGKIR